MTELQKQFEKEKGEEAIHRVYLGSDALHNPHYSQKANIKYVDWLESQVEELKSKNALLKFKLKQHPLTISAKSLKQKP